MEPVEITLKLRPMENGKFNANTTLHPSAGLIDPDGFSVVEGTNKDVAELVRKILATFPDVDINVVQT